MGILNVTPDSFFDGGQYNQQDAILRQATKMLEDGASIIDVGGMSSRPGAEVITVEEELRRVITPIQNILQAYPNTIISIDTVHAKVAEAAVAAGASIVNDISAGKIDDAMYETVAALQVPYILMHMQGQPKDMQDRPEYEDINMEVLQFFIKEVEQLYKLGVQEVVLDPGFGFGKTIAHNYQMLAKMHVFKIMDLPILAGVSRKSMIYKLLDTSPQEALNGTSALHMVALQQGARLLRVHDVREAVEVVRLWECLEENG